MVSKKIKTFVMHNEANILISVTNGRFFHEPFIDLGDYTYKAEVIGNDAFLKCKGMKSLVVPHGYLKLEQCALMFTPTLERLTLPETIECIEKSNSFFLSDSSFAPNLHDITFQFRDKEQHVHSDVGFESIHKTKSGEFICKISENNYIVISRDEVRQVSQISDFEIIDNFDFSSRYENNLYAKGKPDVDITRMTEDQRRIAIKEFSEGLPSLENLLSNFAQRGLVSNGACAGHDTRGGYFSFVSDNIPYNIQRLIINKAKKMGGKVKTTGKNIYIDIPFLERDAFLNMISSQICVLPLQHRSPIIVSEVEKQPLLVSVEPAALDQDNKLPSNDQLEQQKTLEEKVEQAGLKELQIIRQQIPTTEETIEEKPGEGMLM